VKRKIAILFDNIGPYHAARINAASEVCDLLAIELGSNSSEYAWERAEAKNARRITINEAGSSDELSLQDLKKRLASILSNFSPEVVFVPGWNSRGALLSLDWSAKHGVPSVVMSESTEMDMPRSIFKEWIKSNVIAGFSAGLVGGSPHQSYLERLGMNRSRIFQGYDVVDNEYFTNKANEIRRFELEFRRSLGFSGNFFLASARFLRKKNLFGLIKAYASYRQMFAEYVNRQKNEFKSKDSLGELLTTHWDLVILGDGPLRRELEDMRADLKLVDSIHFPGFQQYHILPAYYALAKVFIHPSTVEPWGLVVNEAMAAGLPVIVSNRCGCASDLVKEGINGWTFNPDIRDELAYLMLKICVDRSLRSSMGQMSSSIIEMWGLKKFASGFSRAAEAAMGVSVQERSFISFIVLKALIFR